MTLIGVDFDGTLHDWEHPVPGRRMGPPFPGAKEAMQALRARGYRILIHSCNRPKVIRDWLTYWEIPFDHIWGELPGQEGTKPICVAYIDDRAVGFKGDWSTTLSNTLDLLGESNATPSELLVRRDPR